MIDNQPLETHATSTPREQLLTGISIAEQLQTNRFSKCDCRLRGNRVLCGHHPDNFSPIIYDKKTQQSTDWKIVCFRRRKLLAEISKNRTAFVIYYPSARYNVWDFSHSRKEVFCRATSALSWCDLHVIVLQQALNRGMIGHQSKDDKASIAAWQGKNDVTTW